MLLLALVALLSQSAKAQSWQWAKSGNNIFSDAYFSSGTMATDPNGNLYIISTDSVIKTSGHYRPGYGKGNLCIVSYDCQGNYRWSKMIENGISIEIKTDKIGGVYAAGFVLTKDKSVKLDEDTIIGATHKEYIIVKFDTSGQFKWLRMPESDTVIHVRRAFTPFNMCVSDVGDIRLLVSVLPGVYCDGKYAETDTLTTHIIALNSSGDFVKGIYLDIEKKGFSTNMTWDSQNDKYYFNTTICDKFRIGSTYLEDKGPIICKFNNVGGVEWIKSGSSACAYPYSYRIYGLNRVYNGSLYVTFIAQTGSIFDGYTFTNDSNKGTTAVIIKYDKDGNQRWAFNSKVGAPGGLFFDVSEDKVGAYGLTNSPYIKWADGFEVGHSFISTGNPFKDSFNLGAFFITVDEHTGNILTMDSLLGARLGPKFICGNNKSGFYIAGEMGGIIKKMVVPNIDTVIGTAYNSLFLLKYGDNDCGKLDILTPELTTNKSIKIYPNPGTDFFNIEGATPDSRLRIYNILGQLLSEHLLLQSNQQIPIQDLTSGVYIVELKDVNNKYHHVQLLKL